MVVPRFSGLTYPNRYSLPDENRRTNSRRPLLLQEGPAHAPGHPPGRVDEYPSATTRPSNPSALSAFRESFRPAAPTSDR